MCVMSALSKDVMFHYVCMCASMCANCMSACMSVNKQLSACEVYAGIHAT